MEAFVTALQGQVSASTIFATLAPLATWVGGLILVAIAIHFLRRSVSGAGKGKARI